LASQSFGLGAGLISADETAQTDLVENRVVRVEFLVDAQVRQLILPAGQEGQGAAPVGEGSQLQAEAASTRLCCGTGCRVTERRDGIECLDVSFSLQQAADAQGRQGVRMILQEGKILV